MVQIGCYLRTCRLCQCITRLLGAVLHKLTSRFVPEATATLLPRGVAVAVAVAVRLLFAQESHDAQSLHSLELAGLRDQFASFAHVERIVVTRGERCWGPPKSGQHVKSQSKRGEKAAYSYANILAIGILFYLIGKPMAVSA